ncbi:SLC13 family permease [Desulfosporosinus sp. PR]|uniref:SLC13 family permease n=1 Tax=Candidatus Desulfosporosinus nitrosoreducens TaxID=3401928 RepID=UPI0027E63D29|nr:SLC13 family permease [Desulfosporosinus sp. PR]MDQ7096628.1 SLC13 family permease [Desulfosporosinus sp. PR]
MVGIWKKFLHEITGHALFSISLTAAVVTSFFNIPRWGYIDVKVLVCLFELMLIVKALEEYGLLGHVAVKIVNCCKNERRLTAALCVITFLLSMFTTNDVAVLTIVPILVAISRTCGLSVTFPCVLTTIAANLGSSATPIGNPQNLYIFSFYKMSPVSFFRESVPLCLVSLLLLMASTLFIRPKKIRAELSIAPVTEKKRVAAFLLLSVPVIVGIFGLIPYAITFVFVLLAAIIINRSMLRKLDYRLLLTFLLLFVAVGNISHIPVLKEQIAALETTPLKTYVSALFLSQIISNVPSTVMLAPFTVYAYALFYGANIGGLGTPIASLASVIAFSLFYQVFPHKKLQFIGTFLLCNVIMLFVLSVVFASVLVQV